MPHYYFIGASKDHVLKGMEGGFAQAGHGRKDLISKPGKGDWFVFYSSKDQHKDGRPLQKFTALGQFTDEEAYQPEKSGTFKPYRRNVNFKNCKDTEIRPLLKKLSFITNKKNWGFYIMNGFQEISKEDFEVIMEAMIEK